MTETEDFEVFMRNYQNMVYSTAFRLVAKENDAADIAQDVFLKAFERFQDLRDNPRAGGWLKTVATNLSLNHLSRYRFRWRFFSEMTSDAESDRDFEETLPDERFAMPNLDASFERELLEGALHALPPAQRVPLVLYHFEEHSYEEIAAKLRVSLGKVKTDIHRARQTLRDNLSATACDPRSSQKTTAPTLRRSHVV